MNTHHAHGPLSPEQCLAHATQVGLEPHLWESAVCFSCEDRHAALIEKNEVFESWLLCWDVGNDTGWHDHDGSSIGIFVQSGVIEEAMPTIKGEHNALIEEGQGVCHDGNVIHRMKPHGQRAISIHVYSPPLSSIGIYLVADDGQISRQQQAAVAEPAA